jgi:hypothetical protein
VFNHPMVLLCHLLALLPITWVIGLLGDQLNRVGLKFTSEKGNGGLDSLSGGQKIFKLCRCWINYVAGIVLFLVGAYVA